MQKEKAKQKAVAAIRTIVEAAKELAKAEQAYYGRRTHETTKGRYNDR